MSILCTGWRPNHHLPVFSEEVLRASLKAHSILGAGLLPAEAMRLTGFVDLVTDQGPTSGCVGQAIGNAWVVRMRALGFTPEEPSRLGIYTGGRELAKQLLGEAIADNGSFPRLAWEWAQTRGIGRNSLWASQGFPGYDPATLNQELPVDVLEDESARKLAYYAMIEGDAGTSRVHQIMQALAQDMPVTFGVDVGSAFMQATGADPVPVLDPADDEGGHYLTLLGYTTKTDGSILLRGLNSWNTTWGDRGFFWCTPDFVNQASVGDIGIMEVTNAGPAAKKKEG